MSMRTASVVLYGDVIGPDGDADMNEGLPTLLHARSQPLITAFVERVGHHLRAYLATLPSEQQQLFPPLTTLVDFWARRRDAAARPVVRFFFRSVYQIAQTIQHFSTLPFHAEQGAVRYAFGACTGAFAAAALSCSANVSQLVPTGAAAALVAFATALDSFLAGQRLVLQPVDDVHAPLRSWSTLVSGRGDSRTSDFLEEYVECQGASESSRLWTSGYSSSAKAITVSGAPRAMQRLVDAIAKDCWCQPLDVESPFHASHLFDQTAVLRILRNSLAGIHSLELYPQSPDCAFVSPGGGDVLLNNTFESLLECAVNDALREPLRSHHVLPAIVDQLRSDCASRCDIVLFSSTWGSTLSTRVEKELNIPVNLHRQRSKSRAERGEAYGTFSQSNIAVVGYSGRFPSAESNEAFWDLLMQGQDVHREIPADRFDWRQHFDSEGKRKNTSRIKHGCFIDQPGLFDARFFNMSPREAESADPAQRLAITTAYEAMEMAGMVLNRTPSTQQDRIGVFYGTTSDDWREVNSGQDVDTFFIPGGNRAFVPGRISFFFGFSGPSISFDTACSSSFAAIQSACTYLWRGDCDTALAGGTNILTNPDNFAGLDRAHFLSTTGNCNSFDDAAAGYCRSDAVGSVVLKRLEDAQADNDPILGVILGTNTNHCGHTDSITRPHEGDQASVFKHIVSHANIDPYDVSYVEMHGTGTQAGDATEMRSVLSVFAPDYQRSRSDVPRPLFIGSVKANIGHAESASGVASLIKVLMMMKNDKIPPHCGIKTRLNHTYPQDLSQRGVNIALAPAPWTRGPIPRKAFLNNFSAAGGNTAILLQEGSLVGPRNGVDPRSTHIVAVSAKSAVSLASNIRSILKFAADSGSDDILSQLSYTLTARRMHHKYRVTASAADLPGLITALRTQLQTCHNAPESFKPIAPSHANQPQVVFAFAGQGSLSAELTLSLYDTNPTYRDRLQQLDMLCVASGYPSFISVVDGRLQTTEVRGLSPVVAHLALVCTQVALVDLWANWGVQPTTVVGHSLGEYAALYAAKVLSVADVIYLVGTRAELLRRNCSSETHAMLALSCTMDVAKRLLRSETSCEIACVNHRESHVVAGPIESITALKSCAAGQGVKSTMLEIPYAFHSAQIEPFLDEYERLAAAGATFHPPSVPFVSPMTASVVPVGDCITLNAAYVRAASRGQVDFSGAVQAALCAALERSGKARNVTWLEVGPHSMCSSIIKRNIDNSVASEVVPSLSHGTDAYQTLTAALQILFRNGIAINWEAYHKPFPTAQRVLDLPAYSWDLKNYWTMYRNNFCLTKGDLPAQAEIVALEERRPVYVSPCLQDVLEEDHSAEQSRITVESDLFHEKLLPILQGHRVNAVALCPSSAYVDMAITAAKYMLSRRSSSEIAPCEPLFEIYNVAISKPLIALDSVVTHKFRLEASMDWPHHKACMELYSVDAKGQRTTTHATLDISMVFNANWTTEWQRVSWLIKSRISALTGAAARSSDDVDVMRRKLAYKLFGTLVDYSPEYQGMSEVAINSAELEAVASVDLRGEARDFCIDPRWVDSLGQVAGFIMNANNSFNDPDTVFINHGWHSVRFTEMPKAGKKYLAYNRMSLVGKSDYTGNTYILDGDRVIGVYEGVVFKGIPRRLLNQVLPRQSVYAAVDRTARSAARKAHSQESSGPFRVYNPPATRQAASFSVQNIHLERVESVVCDVIGIARTELKDDQYFEELGVDSLLSLSLVQSLRSEVHIDIPSAFFADNPTVADFRKYIRSTVTSVSALKEENTDSSSDETSSMASYASSRTTPLETGASSPLHSRLGPLLRTMICEETGVDEASLKAGTLLADVGIDSLLALNLGARLREKLDVEIGSITFLEVHTFAELENAICDLLPPSVQERSQTKQTANGCTLGDDHFARQKQTALTKPSPRQDDTGLPTATSILLSGPARNAENIIFLFPDGSGSAASYVAFARAAGLRLGARTAIYGLNCPWRKTAREMTRAGVDFATMLSRYVPEIKRLLQEQRSHTRVILGGWSAGGILAFEAIRRLQQEAQPVHVSHLLLLDSPNPVGLQNPPQRMYDFFESLGIFGNDGAKTAPGWLREHFEVFIEMLDEYRPTVLEPAPKSLIVYAKDGVCKDPHGPQMETHASDPREMLWLLNNRTDFAAEGWSSLLGKKSLNVGVVEDANHFTLMDEGTSMRSMVAIVDDFLSLR